VDVLSSRPPARRRAIVWLTVVGMLWPTTWPLAAAAEPAAQTDGAVEKHWEQVRQLITRGAYREALQELEMILTLTPGDARAQAYRSLCERRLQEAQPFASRNAQERQALQESLKREEQAKARAAAQERAVRKQVEAEQRRWDEEVARLQREDARRRKVLEEEQRRQTPPPPAQSRAQPPAGAASGAQSPSRTEPPDALDDLLPPPPTDSALLDRSDAPPEESSQAEPGAPLRRAGSPATVDAPPPTDSRADDVDQQQSSATPPASTQDDGAPPPATSADSVQLEAVRVHAAPDLAAAGMFPGAVDMSAEHMTVSPERSLAIAEGNVHVVFDQGELTCDRVTVFTDTNDFYAQGRVVFTRGDQTFRGDIIQYNLDTNKGRVLNGTVGMPPWYQHGDSLEHIAEGVVRVNHGYFTSCEFEPPHYRLHARNAVVFQRDRIVRGRNVTMVVEDVPLIYLPWLTVADRQTPFFLIPGKRKPWEEFALMGYRYEWPSDHQGTLRLDWRRTFGWGTGVDHRFQAKGLGKGLVKLYYNQEANSREPKSALPKGADIRRYRALVRHQGRPMPDTTVVTDLQKFSDVDFRKDFLFREEFTSEAVSDGTVSMVTGAPNYSVQALVQKRLNRFQGTTESFPDLTVDVRPSQVRGTQLFVESRANVANLQSRTAHSDSDADVVRVDVFEQVKYALNIVKPVLLTPRTGVRQTYYTKDIQGGIERPDGERDVVAGQWNNGLDGSLKLFKILPVTTKALGLEINWLRHVLSPTFNYSYVHDPTVPSALLNFSTAQGTTNSVTLGLENKLQTKRRRTGTDPKKKPQMDNVDLVRWLVSLPYSFHGAGNEQGGRYGDWTFDLEMFPWRWVRLESDWVVPSHFVRKTYDDRVTRFNLDMILVGGREGPEARTAPGIRAPATRDSGESSEQFGQPLLPTGQWYVGLGHRYFQNDKTDDVIQFDWRPTNKWQIGTFHRITWKQMSGGAKRFNHVREWQYRLTRDLHDWMAEMVYHVDREFGEEVFVMLTLKAFPGLPIEMGTSYHAPKSGSQSSPFSPIAGQH
jgi:hypothetical protein